MFGEVHTRIQKEEIEKFVGTALKLKCWIYEEKGEGWCTPEEFLVKHELVGKFKDDWKSQYRMVKPLAGIQIIEERLNKAQKERSYFVNRMLAYYTKHLQ